MTSTRTKPKPGEFRAACRTGAYLPTDELTVDEREWAAAEHARRKAAGEYLDVYRWDKRLKAETVMVRCDLDTTDPAEYLAHMERVHGRKPATWAASKVTHNGRLAAATRRPWKAPKLTEEGAPWIDKEGRTRACRGCGFVVELGSGSTAVIEAHRALCAERGAA